MLLFDVGAFLADCANLAAFGTTKNVISLSETHRTR